MKDWIAREEIRRLGMEIRQLVKCETCKCLLKKYDATKGKPEVRMSYMGDYIYYPYYCEIHKPKEKK